MIPIILFILSMLTLIVRKFIKSKDTKEKLANTAVGLLMLVLLSLVVSIELGFKYQEKNLINGENYYSIELINNLNQNNKSIFLKDQNGELIELKNENNFKVNEMVEDGKVIHTYKIFNTEVKVPFYVILGINKTLKEDNVYFVNSKTLISIFQ